MSWERSSFCGEPTMRNQQLSASLTVVLMGVMLVGPRLTYAQTAGPCGQVPTAIAGGTSDTLVVPFDGRGWGQVIELSDTVVAQVSFEMPESLGFNWSKAVLYVTNVDSDGRPDVISQPLFSSLVVGPPPHPGTGQVPLVFQFNPPITLPRLGKYFFDVNEDACAGVMRLQASTLNPYPGGAAWSTGQSCSGLGPGPISLSDPRVDLMCSVEYCELVTPTARRTWGGLKVIYR